MFVCEQCGKKVEWEYSEGYVYKKTITVYTSKEKPLQKTIKFCGWNCMREWEKEEEKKQWQKRK